MAVQAAELEIPAFQLRPEGIFDRLGSMIGMQDIDFSDHPEFSNAFVLKTNDEQSTRDFFDRPLLDYFSERQGVSFETSRHLFIYFRKDKQVDPYADAIQGFLAEGFVVLQELKERHKR
ncbi:MAG: hypothetical protein WBD31_14070 [Rubripirellula sp.]